MGCALWCGLFLTVMVRRMVTVMVHRMVPHVSHHGVYLAA